MADIEAAQRNGGGVAFLVSAGIVYEIIAAACSSPQTTEINAKARAKTLMKWVYIGEAMAFVFVVIAAWIDQKRRKPILAGGFVAMVFMHVAYVYGKASGLKSPEPGTEDYGSGQSQPAGVPEYAFAGAG